MPDRERTATGISRRGTVLQSAISSAHRCGEYHTTGEPRESCIADYAALESYIASLEAERDRLNVLEEMLEAGTMQTCPASHDTYVASVGFCNTFREAADAELKRPESP